MEYTEKELLMYQIMKSIYDYSTLINFKGSMVIKACLCEMGYLEQTRHTVDIDGNWYSETNPSEQEMVDVLQQAINKVDCDIYVEVFRMYGNGRSAGFDIKKNGSVLFSMDIDVNRPKSLTKIYEVNNLHFRGVSPAQIIADKVSAISTDKVFRRVKDLLDIYYFAQVCEFNASEILETVTNSGRQLENFNAFLNRIDELEHAYLKFKVTEDVYKPPFNEVYQTVHNYIKDILPLSYKDKNKCEIDIDLEKQQKHKKKKSKGMSL